MMIMTIIQDNVIVLVNIVIGIEGLVILRVDAGNIEVFQAFIRYCLVYFSTSMNWRYIAYTVLISDIFKESDEALLCIFYCLENNAEDYAKIYDSKRKISRKGSRTKNTCEC